MRSNQRLENTGTMFAESQKRLKPTGALEQDESCELITVCIMVHFPISESDNRNLFFRRRDFLILGGIEHPGHRQSLNSGQFQRLGRGPPLSR